jgi:hypothetical protein
MKLFSKTMGDVASTKSFDVSGLAYDVTFSDGSVEKLIVWPSRPFRSKYDGHVYQWCSAQSRMSDNIKDGEVICVGDGCRNMSQVVSYARVPEEDTIREPEIWEERKTVYRFLGIKFLVLSEWKRAV